MINKKMGTTQVDVIQVKFVTEDLEELNIVVREMEEHINLIIRPQIIMFSE